MNLILIPQASYEMLYSQYLDREEDTMETIREEAGDQSTVEVMQAILNVNKTKKSCQIMWNKFVAHCSTQKLFTFEQNQPEV